MTAPAAPALHTVEDIASTSVFIAWTTGEPRDVEIDGVSHVTQGPPPRYWASNLTPSTTYMCRTRSNDGVNPPSEWTVEVPFSTVAPAPSGVLPITDLTPTGYTARWADGSLRDVQYLVGTGGGQFDPPVVVGSALASGVRIDGLTPGTSHRLQTRTLDPLSEWTDQMVNVPLPLPTGVVVSAITDTSFHAEWPPVVGATGYYVRWKSLMPYDGIAMTTSYDVVGLTPGTTYNLRIKAANDTGQTSEWSVTTPVTTTGGETGPEPSPPPTKHSVPLPVRHDAEPVGPQTIGLYPVTDWQSGNRFSIAGVEIGTYNVGAEVKLWDVGWCEDPLDETKDPTPRTPPLDPFEPLVPYAVDECGLSPASLVEVPERARHGLTLLEQVRVEAKFAERLLADSPPPVGTFDFVAAVGELEAELAARGMHGYIHASPKFAAEAAVSELLLRGPTGFETPLGHTWVFGGGYVDILGDVLVASSKPYGWRSDVTVNSVTDHTHNRVLAVAERTVVIGYEAVFLSVSVTPSTPLADSPAAQSSTESAPKKKTEPSKAKS